MKRKLKMTKKAIAARKRYRKQRKRSGAVRGARGGGPFMAAALGPSNPLAWLIPF